MKDQNSRMWTGLGDVLIVVGLLGIAVLMVL